MNKTLMILSALILIALVVVVATEYPTQALNVIAVISLVVNSAWLFLTIKTSRK